MLIYFKNVPAKFHSNLIRNDGALGFFEDGRQNKKKNKNNNNNNNKTRRVATRDQFLI